MKLLIDARAASLFTPSTQDGGRHYYIAVAPFLAIIRCDDMDLPAARGRVVDAQIGWDEGTPGFVREKNVGRRHTKVTIRRVLGTNETAARDLLNVLANAPRETQKDPVAQRPSEGKDDGIQPARHFR